MRKTLPSSLFILTVSLFLLIGMNLSVQGQISTFPACEDFATVTPVNGGNTNPGIPPSSWSIRNTNLGASPFTWEFRTTATTTTTGTGPDRDNTLAPATGGVFAVADVTNGAAGDGTTMNTATYNVSALILPQFSFYYHRFGNPSPGTGTLPDLVVEVTSNGGVSWTNVATITGQTHTSAADPYTQYLATLPAFIGSNALVFRFILTSNGCCLGDVAIDDICVEEAPPCPNPQNLSASNVGGTTADLSWTVGGNCGAPNMTTVEYGPSGFTPGTGTIVMVTCPVTFPVMLTGLSQNTAYDFYVQEDCGGAGMSGQVGPESFLTGCTTPPQTDIENFDTQGTCATTCGTACVLTGLWVNTTTDGFDWIVDNSGTPTASTGPSQDVTFVQSGGTSNGNYLYVESSNALCQLPNEAELISTCVDVGADANFPCHMSFYYHMYGPDVGTMQLDISTNSGLAWTNLWNLTGNQGDMWSRGFVDLSAYDGQTVKFRFLASRAGAGGLGDMAIDHIEFFGSTIGTNYTYYEDSDGDTYGNSDAPIIGCSLTPPTGYVANSGDCDDGDGMINPGASEITCNGIDENCNGNADDALVLPAPGASGDMCIVNGASAMPTGTAISGGNLFWFDAPSGGMQVGSGAAPTIGPITSDMTFYLQEATSGFGLGASSSPLLITEVSTDYSLSSADMIEIQNFSPTSVNYTGWRVFVSNSYSNIDLVNTIAWNLGTMTAGQALFRTDVVGNNYWGNNIFWNPGAITSFRGWALIMDNNNVVRDAVFWGWTSAQIATMNAAMGGTTVTGTNVGWVGNGLTISATCGATAANEAMQRVGNQDNDTDMDWICTAYQPGAQNPGLTTISCSSPLVPVNVYLEDSDDAYHESECALAGNDGVECASLGPVTAAGTYIANTICSAPTTVLKNGPGTSTGGSPLPMIPGCPTIDFNQNPAFLAVQASLTGQLDITVTNPGGNVTNVQGVLVGPITAPATIGQIALMPSLACNENATSFTLSFPAAVAGQVYMLIVDSDGTGPIPINLNGTVFPIDLGSLKATKVENISLVEWSTLTETNNAFFEVERSGDGDTFSYIGTVQGNGNSQTAIDYEFVDELPLSGTNFYRLKQVDLDGNAKYSKVVSTYFEFDEFVANVFPNPFKQSFTLNLQTDRKSKAEVQLLDLAGRKVFSQKVEIKSGMNEIDIEPGDQLVQGSYLFILKFQGRVKAFKVFKEN